MNKVSDAAIGYLFGFFSALAYGIAHVLVRRGVSELAPPLVGATFAFISGLFVLSLVASKDIKVNLPNIKIAGGFFILSGFASSVGVTCLYFAMSYAPVVVVSPVSAISPLIAILVTYLFLRRLERVTKRVALGAFLVVIGVALIAIARAL